jgi:hypothetical protein
MRLPRGRLGHAFKITATPRAAAPYKERKKMKKAILIPDSFKGSLSSLEICEIMQKSIRAHHPDCETVSIPVADGGEGSVDCFLSAMDGRRV